MDESTHTYPTGELTLRRRIVRLFTAGDWAARILIESGLIVMSILAALAVNEWQNRKANQELATQALTVFRREIEQNQARLAGLEPVHQGLRDALVSLSASGALSTAEQFHQNLAPEQFRPPFLTSTAWETSLTTGAIPHIEFEVVNALSMTYSIQRRFIELSRISMPTLARGGSPVPEQMPGAVRELVIYLTDLSRGEADLLAAYDQVLAILDTALPADSLAVDSAATDPDVDAESGPDVDAESGP